MGYKPSKRLSNIGTGSGDITAIPDTHSPPAAPTAKNTAGNATLGTIVADPAWP